MAAKSKAGTTKTAPGPLIIVALVVVLALFVGFMAYRHFVAPPSTPGMGAEARAKNDRLKALATQSGGDINKLSPEDRNWVNSVTGGYGGMALRGLARDKK